jgi:hypothetical protein
MSHYRTTDEPVKAVWTFKLASNETGVVMSLKKQNSIKQSVPGAHGTRVLPSHSNTPMELQNAPSLCGGAIADTWRAVFASMPAAALVVNAVCREICAHCSVQNVLYSFSALYCG